MNKLHSFAIVMSIMAAVSCSKSGGSPSSTPRNPPVDPPVVTPNATIAAQINSGAQYTTLKAAMTYAGLASTWDAAGPYTVFAPIDSAFNTFGLTPAQIVAIPSDTVKNALLYHALNVKLLSSDIPEGKETRFICANGDSMFVTRNVNGVFVNGIRVRQADILAGNGVIHTLTDVLQPTPNVNIVEGLANDPDFALLSHIIQRASTGTTNIAQVLGSSSVTFFAPTLTAIRASKYPFATDVNAANPDSLAHFLLDQTFEGRIFGCDMGDGTKLVSLTGGKATVSKLIVGYSVKGTAGASPGLIVAKDQMTRNGVIHVVDHVLTY
jgi:uncharacterized surface protein with fasciclin (FAS1) repeats